MAVLEIFWSPQAMDWYSSFVQKPPLQKPGGFGITPNAASSIAADYSAKAHDVSWRSQLPQLSFWARGQNLSRWHAPNLLALTDTHMRLLQDFQCVEGNRQDASADASLDHHNEDAAAPATPSLSFRHEGRLLLRSHCFVE